MPSRTSQFSRTMGPGTIVKPCASCTLEGRWIHDECGVCRGIKALRIKRAEAKPLLVCKECGVYGIKLCEPCKAQRVEVRRTRAREYARKHQKAYRQWVKERNNGGLE
jgi:hypothetical protein